MVLILLLTFARPLAFARERARPQYGIECTITNPTLIRAHERNGYDRMYRVWKEIAASARPVEMLYRFREEFPDQYVVFEQFVAAAFGREGLSPLLAHKRGFPAYRKTTPDGSWLQVQLEHQALELQAPERSLLEYLPRTEMINCLFFAPGRAMGLEPDPRYGMGHISEGLDVGYEHLRTLRNRLVNEIRYRYFWALMGPDVQAGIMGEYGEHRARLDRFVGWLRQFDSWLARSHLVGSDEIRLDLLLEIFKSVTVDPVFENISLNMLGETLQVLKGLVSIDVEQPGGHVEVRKLFKDSLSLILIEAFRALKPGKGAAVGIKIYDTPEGWVPLLEHRRIPAQKDADEAAMWMSLLEGHWENAANSGRLAPIVVTDAPRTDEERLELFKTYVERARRHPADFKKFLPRHLAARVGDESPFPRWTVLRERLLCEGRLAEIAAGRP